MSIFHDNAVIGSSSQQGYNIERSLRFNSADSAYLNRTPASAGNRRTFTWSGWFKVGNHSSSGEYYLLGTNGTADNTFFYIEIRDNQLRLGSYNSGTFGLFSTQLFRDPSAWYHLVVAVDTTQATAANRAKAYVNGTEITTWSTANYPSQNSDLGANDTRAHAVGAGYASGSPYAYWDGLLTECHFIDGQALTPSSFGETDTITGVWKPKKYAGTYGTNGFYLKFADNSNTTAATLGKDSSGNGNNWTPNNFSVTAGSGNDSMIDTPTPYADGGNGRGNYATLNPLDANGGNFFNGNLEYAGPYSSFSAQNGHGCRSTLKVRPTGKWYAEAANITYSGSGNSCMLGFTSSIQAFTATAFGSTLTPWIGVDASVFNNRILLQWNGVAGGTASATQLFASYASGDVVNFAIDFDAGKFWVGKNGTWYNSGDPAAGTNATSTFTAGSSDWAFWGEYVAASDNSNRSSVLVNFGQRTFAYTPPSGFLALNTQNLPTPTIQKPSVDMDVVTYTGTGSALTPTSSLGFSPALVWIKGRSGATDHALYDIVRGVQRRVESNNTDAEVTTDGGLTAFNSNGFTLGTLAQVNTNTATYVAWCWDAGSSTVTNTAGSINTQVRANTSAGFSVVTYTATANNNTIGHGLGVAPQFVILKSRNVVIDWQVGHQSIGWTDRLFLNQISAKQTTNFAWNNSAPTSTVVRLGGNTSSQVGGTYVAYCWAPVAGYSFFGSYTGNGSTDGPFVFTGFRPRYVLTKRTDSTSNWYIQDTARSSYNLQKATLFAESSIAEAADGGLDFLSNGFKVRNTDSSQNASGGTYIFAAFAESPFKYSLAR